MSKRIIILIFLVLLWALVLTGCTDLRDQEPNYPKGLSSYGDIRAYTYDPKTIITSLDNGSNEIFHPLSDWALERVFSPGSFTWQQQDYLKISHALNWVANQDSLKEWSVYSIDASRYCADILIGFDSFSIAYFKAVGERYATREIDVWPLAKEADWAGNKDFPRPVLSTWKSIDLEKLKVTTDDALKIAEANGGKVARQAANNNCSILVMLSPNTNHVNWDVEYFSGGSTKIFSLSIDPYNDK